MGSAFSPKNRQLPEPSFSAFRNGVFTGATLCSPDQILDLCDQLHALIRVKKGWRRSADGGTADQPSA